MSSGGLERAEITVRGMRISYLSKGSTGPTTLYLHGLGAEAAQTRPLASGVSGRSVLIDLPSHGESGDVPQRIDLDELVEIVSALAAREGATQALGVSLGSAILLRWLISRPEDLTRAVLYLPAAVTQPRPRGRLRAALGSDDALREYVAGELPAHIAQTPLAQRWLTDRAEALLRAGIGAYAEMLETEAPIPDPRRAGVVPTQLLVIGAEGDRLHPVAAASEAADCFPHGRRRIFTEPAPLWTARRELRRTIAGFFDGSAPLGRTGSATVGA